MKYFIVGKRDGRRIIQWGRVIMWTLLVGVVFVVGIVLLVCLPDYCNPNAFLAAALITGIIFLLFVVIPLVRGLCLPLERLPELNPPRTFVGRSLDWLFSGRMVRRYFFCCACLVTLVAFLWVEENWRGRHDLKKFETEWEAKGEKFDFQSFAPPPVPENQNFAMAPVVASTYEGSLDKNGHRISPPDTNVVNRLEMRRELTLPGLESPPPGNQLKGNLTDLKAWQDYYRKAAARTNFFPVPPQPQSPAEDVLLALSNYDSTIEELRLASRRPYSRFPLNYDTGFFGTTLLSHLSALKGCAQVLQSRAVAELELGQTEKALADVKLMFHLVNSIRAEPILISHLVRMALVSIAIEPVWEGLAEHKWSDAQLAELETELARLDFLADYEFAMRGERACNLSGLEYLRRTHSTGILDYDSGAPESENRQQFGLRLMPDGWFYQNELAIARMYQQWTLPAIDTRLGTISPTRIQQNEVTMTNQLNRFSPYTIFARMLMPAFSRAAERFARVQSDVDLARVACALERYRLANGQYPESLDALSPQFIAKIPHDIINGQPLKYRRTDNPPSQSSGAAGGGFLLYSVGWNEKDDGGTVALKKGGMVDTNQGDWVWQHPAG